jgi:hypothetical protein
VLSFRLHDEVFILVCSLVGFVLFLQCFFFLSVVVVQAYLCLDAVKFRHATWQAMLKTSLELPSPQHFPKTADSTFI